MHFLHSQVQCPHRTCAQSAVWRLSRDGACVLSIRRSLNGELCSPKSVCTCWTGYAQIAGECGIAEVESTTERTSRAGMTPRCARPRRPPRPSRAATSSRSPRTRTRRRSRGPPTSSSAWTSGAGAARATHVSLRAYFLVLSCTSMGPRARPCHTQWTSLALGSSARCGCHALVAEPALSQAARATHMRPGRNARLSCSLSQRGHCGAALLPTLGQTPLCAPQEDAAAEPRVQ